jgi:hypothetical protein
LLPSRPATSRRTKPLREIARLYGVTLDEPTPQPDTARSQPDHPSQKPRRRITNVTSGADGEVAVDVEEIGQPAEKRLSNITPKADGSFEVNGDLDIEEVPAEPAPGGFADVFGSIEGPCVT